MKIETHSNETGTKRSRYELFSSLVELVDYAAATPKSKRQASDERNTWQCEWAKSDSLEHAMELAHKGYAEIRPQVEALMEVMEERLAERFGNRFVTDYAVSGGSVDMGKFVTGEPECMLEWVSEPAASMGRVVKVCLAGTVSSDIKPDMIIRRGTAVVALLDTLHKLGVGLELWWDSTIRGSDMVDHSTAVLLHDSSEPLDVDNLMWAVAHPSMLRRVTFAVQERSQTAKAQGVGGGYGRCTDMALPRIMDFDVTVERLQRGDLSESDPLAWVIQTVEGLGFTE